MAAEAVAQTRRSGSVQQSASHTRQHAPQRGLNAATNSAADEDEDDDEDWDFLSDEAVLALVAQQQAEVSEMKQQCAQSLPPARVNDDYCDCDDGSDEPLTSACSHVLAADARVFQCASGEQVFASVFVHDGVCDCCDGSDEDAGKCENTCSEFHTARLENLVTRVEAVRTGLQIRDAYFTQYEPKIEGIAAVMHETMDIANAVERAFQFKQKQLQASGKQPSRQEMHDLESMYYELQNWQYQAYLLHKVLDKHTFADKAWKEPYAVLVGQCFEYKVNEKELKGGTANVIPREYLFTFCPFQNVTQTEPSYPQWTVAERNEKKDRRFQTQQEQQEPIPEMPQGIMLGMWDQWTPALERSSTHYPHAQRYNHGRECANGQERIVNVELSCGAVNRVLSLDEPEMCVYSLAFMTPAACEEREEARLEQEIEHVQALLQGGSASNEKGTTTTTSTTHEEL
uniref:Glucosidase 2 subunit beta n=1 Tax=Globisporangium ultimum (strain ATCC 200006 / CBS 805.95 / DAOM BR144) TaxID=431595 RepID=K3X195_GLOUD